MYRRRTIFGIDPTPAQIQALILRIQAFDATLTPEERASLDAAKDDPKAKVMQDFLMSPSADQKPAVFAYIDNEPRYSPALKIKLKTMVNGFDSVSSSLSTTLPDKTPAKTDSNADYIGAGGGAVAGFMVGGPVGGLIGGALGWLVGDAFKK